MLEVQVGAALRPARQGKRKSPKRPICHARTLSSLIFWPIFDDPGTRDLIRKRSLDFSPYLNKPHDAAGTHEKSVELCLGIDFLGGVEQAGNDVVPPRGGRPAEEDDADIACFVVLFFRVCPDFPMDLQHEKTLFKQSSN